MMLRRWRARIARWFRAPICLDGRWGEFRFLAEGDWYTSMTGQRYEIRDGYWQPKGGAQ